MANPTQIPEDLIVPGSIRTEKGFSPLLARNAILAQAALQAFTVPLESFQHDGDTAMIPGTGISLGSGTICQGRVSRSGGLIKTEIFIDMTGLTSAAVGDIIGKVTLANCHIGNLSAALNGTIVHGQITCLETPAGGDPDIDFYSTVTEATGTQDAAISGLTGEVVFTANGDWSAAIATPIALSALPGVGYMYMVDAGGTAAIYTAGQFLLELWGTATPSLEYVAGTYATNAPSLQTPDCGRNNAAASYTARAEIPVPWEYEAGQSVTIRLSVGMLTAVADQTATVDIAVYKSDEDATSTGDLVATTAVSDNMNNTVFADVDFVITPTTLAPGDLLDVQITVAVDDNATAVTRGSIGSVQLLCDVR